MRCPDPFGHDGNWLPYCVSSFSCQSDDFHSCCCCGTTTIYLLDVVFSSTNFSIWFWCLFGVKGIVAQNKISYILDSTAISYLGNVLINALFATKKRMKLRPQTKYQIYFVCTANINFIYWLFSLWYSINAKTLTMRWKNNLLYDKDIKRLLTIVNMTGILKWIIHVLN